MAGATQENGRRRWIKVLLGTGLVSSITSFLYPAIRFMLPPPVPESTENEVLAGNVSDLRPNSGKIFKFGSRPGILIRTQGGEWRAFSAVCTHLGCTVQYRDDTEQIWCACHNGLYDLNGNVLGGPPPRPLEQYLVNIRGNEVVVSRRV